MTDKHERSPRLSERVVTLVGIAASVVGAILLPVLARGDGTKIDVLLGGVFFVMGSLFTLDLASRARIRDMEQALLQRLDDVEKRRFGALPLQRLLSVPDIEDAILDVVGAAADARAKRMQFLANRTIERINEDREETLRIASGIFRCADRREELRLMRFALMDTRTSVEAVAGLGLECWRQPQWQAYFDTYLEFAPTLMQRRIFLVTPEEMEDPAMHELLSWHADAGVETYAMDKTRLDADQCQPLVLFDRLLLLSHRVSQEGSKLEVHFTDELSKVRDAQENVDALMRTAKRTRNPVVLWPAPPHAPDA